MNTQVLKIRGMLYDGELQLKTREGCYDFDRRSFARGMVEQCARQIEFCIGNGADWLNEELIVKCVNSFTCEVMVGRVNSKESLDETQFYEMLEVKGPSSHISCISFQIIKSSEDEKAWSDSETGGYVPTGYEDGDCSGW